MTHFPDNIMTALKEAVVRVFWRRADVRRLFEKCGVPERLTASQDWNQYKYLVVSPILDTLNSDLDGLGALRRILRETLEYTDGKHLLRYTDGERLQRDAERALDHLRLLVEKRDSDLKVAQAVEARRLAEQQEVTRASLFSAKLDALRQRFLDYYTDGDRQSRGYGLEEILYDLFLLFELSPRGAFRRAGEQIDGAFSHEGTPFLLEAKWQAVPVRVSDLRDLDGAVGSSLDNTLGLFISINGFSQEALQGYLTGNRPRIICMDGMDLMVVLEGQIDLPDLLGRKREVAVAKRVILASASGILRGEY
jgi:hypothetical protein